MRELAFPPPALPPAHPLTALAVKVSAPPGMLGTDWQLFDPAELQPLGRVLTRLRADVRALYSTGAAWGSDAVRARLDSALAELAQVVADEGIDVAALGRYLHRRRPSGPIRSREADDRHIAKLIRQEQNRIDHRAPKGTR
ncbi:hypothetical protein ACIGO9_26750 [Nocardia asteroides]|uniref:hypothetical protein n=1 Tax=Nocardia asteroides TaxID=1824 RepID=UPI0037CBA3D7